MATEQSTHGSVSIQYQRVLDRWFIWLLRCNVGVGTLDESMKVYVAGPYTKGDVAVNVRDAIIATNELLDLGYIPYCPHLSHFWHLVTPRPYEDWLAIDMEWLRECDTVLRLDGESSGADLEVAEAKILGMEVYYGKFGMNMLRLMSQG
jgi:hypothetical protein